MQAVIFLLLAMQSASGHGSPDSGPTQLLLCQAGQFLQSWKHLDLVINCAHNMAGPTVHSNVHLLVYTRREPEDQDRTSRIQLLMAAATLKRTFLQSGMVPIASMITST